MTFPAEFDDVFSVQRLVVFDTEFTALKKTPLENWNRDGHQREAVQIGAVLLDGALKELSSFSVLIKPILNPRLSEYFVSLTGITNDLVAENGIDLPEALKRFSQFCRNAERICAFGRDADFIRANCRSVDVEFPFSMDRFVNVRHALCSLAGVASDSIVSSSLPTHFGLPEAERKHHGLSDARTIAKVLREVRRRRGGASRQAETGTRELEANRHD